MLFNSFEFFMFFPIVTLAYFILPHKYRWALLLGASYYFYMAWKPEYIVLIILSTCVDYFASIKMEKVDCKRRRKIYLYFSLATNLGLLFYFKYFTFFIESFKSGAAYFMGQEFAKGTYNILVPMGISFYTFQTLSYTIDVYRGKRGAEKNFGIFALYVTFFPQLVAGPIERSESLLPQFYEKHDFDYERVVEGLRRILWGLFKKMIIADQVRVMVNSVYDKPTDFYGWPLVIATFGFAVQIYCDFSGYSDIAIGAAKVLGFKLMENFDMPYFSKSISQFWKRWHISLSTWFKDYVYIPLGGNRVKVSRVYFNLFATFLVSGLWHGANWTFVAWGALHGIYLIFERVWNKVTKGKNILPNIVRRINTFIFVCLGWIFFRAKSIGDALYIIKNSFKGLGNIKEAGYMKNVVLSMDLKSNEVIVLGIAILVLFTWQIIAKRDDAIVGLRNRNIIIRWSAYILLIYAIIFFGVFSSNEFIYFQF